MTDRDRFPDPREEDIMAGDRRISRPDASVPDWEVPDTSYRPIPIVWFTGAMLLQVVAVSILVAIFARFGDWLAIGLSALSSGAIGKWTWERGMHSASFGWRFATVVMLIIGVVFAIALADSYTPARGTI